MVTNTASQTAHSKTTEENHRATDGPAEWKGQGTVLFSGQWITKGFGTLSTALIGAAALAPNTFGIPTDLQPWIFVAAIFWLLAFCAGMFDL
jgi:hypothetical protein